MNKYKKSIIKRISIRLIKAFALVCFGVLFAYLIGNLYSLIAGSLFAIAACFVYGLEIGEILKEPSRILKIAEICKDINTLRQQTSVLDDEIKELKLKQLNKLKRDVEAQEAFMKRHNITT